MGRKEPSPLALVGAGFEFAAVITILGLGGWWLDGKWGTKPWLLITGVTIGLVGGIYKFWRTGRQFFD
jgi:F0F1-type ATP synthase assembly protein I